MFLRLFLVFTIVPIIEVWLLIKIGRVIENAWGQAESAGKSRQIQEGAGRADYRGCYLAPFRTFARQHAPL